MVKSQTTARACASGEMAPEANKARPYKSATQTRHASFSARALETMSRRTLRHERVVSRRRRQRHANDTNRKPQRTSAEIYLIAFLRHVVTVWSAYGSTTCNPILFGACAFLATSADISCWHAAIKAHANFTSMTRKENNDQ